MKKFLIIMLSALLLITSCTAPVPPPVETQVKVIPTADDVKLLSTTFSLIGQYNTGEDRPDLPMKGSSGDSLVDLSVSGKVKEEGIMTAIIKAVVETTDGVKHDIHAEVDSEQTDGTIKDAELIIDGRHLDLEPYKLYKKLIMAMRNCSGPDFPYTDPNGITINMIMGDPMVIFSVDFEYEGQKHKAIFVANGHTPDTEIDGIDILYMPPFEP